MATVSATDVHLAQFNFARAQFQPDDARMKDFVDALDEINQLSERSPGFVWRLQTEAGHSIDLRPFPDDNLKLITLSVWKEGPSGARHNMSIASCAAKSPATFRSRRRPGLNSSSI